MSEVYLQKTCEGLDLSQFGIDDTTGFLYPRPLASFSTKTFCVLDDVLDWVIRNISVSGSEMRSYLHNNLPHLSIEWLEDEELPRAQMIYHFLQAVYLKKDPPIARVPGFIAHPAYLVAMRHGRHTHVAPRGLTYESYVLANWRRQISRKSFRLNITPFIRFTDTQDEQNFITCHILTELAMARAISHIPFLELCSRKGDSASAIQCLMEISDSIYNATNEMSLISSVCGPDVYHNSIRPFLTETTGVTIDDVPEIGENQSYTIRGSSGAQSAILETLDALLGITFSGDAEFRGGEHSFDHMPIGHRRFVCELRERNFLRPFVVENKIKEMKLRDAYNRSILAVGNLRKVHKYTIIPYVQNVSRGTGGTRIGTWLSKRVEKTERHIIT
jgi:indoleamine 2,3-dioxygenase